MQLLIQRVSLVTGTTSKKRQKRTIASEKNINQTIYRISFECGQFFLNFFCQMYLLVAINYVLRPQDESMFLITLILEVTLSLI